MYMISDSMHNKNGYMISDSMHNKNGEDNMRVA